MPSARWPPAHTLISRLQAHERRARGQEQDPRQSVAFHDYSVYHVYTQRQSRAISPEANRMSGRAKMNEGAKNPREGRSLPAWLADVVQSFELHARRLVTADDVQRARPELSRGLARLALAELVRRGWLVPVGVRGTYEFIPGAVAGTYPSSDPGWCCAPSSATTRRVPRRRDVGRLAAWIRATPAGATPRRDDPLGKCPPAAAGGLSRAAHDAGTRARSHRQPACTDRARARRGGGSTGAAAYTRLRAGMAPSPVRGGACRRGRTHPARPGRRDAGARRVLRPGVRR